MISVRYQYMYAVCTLILRTSVRSQYAVCTPFVRRLYANLRTSVRSRYDLSTLFVRWFAYISTISDEDAFYKVHSHVAEKGIRLSP